MKSLHLTTLLKRPSPFTSPPRHTTLFNLPPSLRTRSFHASPRKQYLDTALLATHSALETIHTVTGLPWVYTLPLSALLIRLTIILPITLHNRSLLQRQISLFPLLSAWRYVLQKKTMAEVGHKGPAVATNMLLRKVRAKRVEIYKRFGAQSWKTMTLPFLQLPVFLIVIETVRKMAGQHAGLAGMVWGRVTGLFGGSEETATGLTEGMVEEVVKRTVQIEPTLATEGALWFPDLLVADPQLVLPFMLSGAILLNIFGKLPSAAAPVVEGVWQRRVKRGLGIFALAIGPLTMHVPSAMLVYWISSSLLAYLQAIALELWRPLKKSAGPCEPKRPLVNGIGLGRRKVTSKEA